MLRGHVERAPAHISSRASLYYARSCLAARPALLPYYYSRRCTERCAANRPTVCLSKGAAGRNLPNLARAGCHSANGPLAHPPRAREPANLTPTITRRGLSLPTVSPLRPLRPHSLTSLSVATLCHSPRFTWPRQPSLTRSLTPPSRAYYNWLHSANTIAVPYHRLKLAESALKSTSTAVEERLIAQVSTQPNGATVLPT